MDNLDRITSFLLKPVSQACKEFHLLEDGDRIAVAVSGGKDSRALWDLLHRYRGRVPYSYDLVAFHITGTPGGSPDLTDRLERWFQGRGDEYRIVPLDLPPDEPRPLDCFRCSWNRRKTLFTAALEEGCNKLAFGHHADDAAVTSLLNLLFGGRLETLAPAVEFFSGRITVIRPLIYVPEKELARYGWASGFPEPPPCSQGRASHRERVRAFLRLFGREQKQIRANLWRAARTGQRVRDELPVPGENL